MDHIRGRASQAAGRRFTYYSYGTAAALLQSLASQYPGLASLSTTQDTFGLPPVGKCQDDHGVEGPCLNYVLEITNRTGSEAERRARPQIYISGALHGDEQVGVVTALELCRWLTERYDSDPWVRRPNYQPPALPAYRPFVCEGRAISPPVPLPQCFPLFIFGALDAPDGSVRGAVPFAADSDPALRFGRTPACPLTPPARSRSPPAGCCGAGAAARRHAHHPHLPDDQCHRLRPAHAHRARHRSKSGLPI